MGYLKAAFLAVLAICLATLAFANRDPVTVKLFPEGLVEATGFNLSITLPLFVVICGGIIAGIMVGFVWEWFREIKHRSEAESERSARRRAEREMKKLKADLGTGSTEDEVLALIDGSAR